MDQSEEERSRARRVRVKSVPSAGGWQIAAEHERGELVVGRRGEVRGPTGSGFGKMYGDANVAGFVAERTVREADLESAPRDRQRERSDDAGAGKAEFGRH